jgi:hypothetical protein
MPMVGEVQGKKESGGDGEQEVSRLTLELPSLFLFAAVRLVRSSPSSSAACPLHPPQLCLLDRFLFCE